MLPLSEMLKPRPSVFADAASEDVLNLSEFAEGSISAEKFFSENFKTQGMNMLFDTAFKRFKGASETGIIKLTQNMGGGKTHNMIALALIASAPPPAKKTIYIKYSRRCRQCKGLNLFRQG